MYYGTTRENVTECLKDCMCECSPLRPDGFSCVQRAFPPTPPPTSSPTASPPTPQPTLNPTPLPTNPPNPCLGERDCPFASYGAAACPCREGQAAALAGSACDDGLLCNPDTLKCVGCIVGSENCYCKKDNSATGCEEGLRCEGPSRESIFSRCVETGGDTGSFGALCRPASLPEQIRCNRGLFCSIGGLCSPCDGSKGQVGCPCDLYNTSCAPGLSCDLPSQTCTTCPVGCNCDNIMSDQCNKWSCPGCMNMGSVCSYCHNDQICIAKGKKCPDQSTPREDLDCSDLDCSRHNDCTSAAAGLCVYNVDDRCPGIAQGGVCCDCNEGFSFMSGAGCIENEVVAQTKDPFSEPAVLGGVGFAVFLCTMALLFASYYVFCRPVEKDSKAEKLKVFLKRMEVDNLDHICLCGRNFASDGDLQLHALKRGHRPEDIDSLDSTVLGPEVGDDHFCPVCFENYATEEDLQLHQAKRGHGDSKAVTAEEAAQLGDGQDWVCDVCGGVYVTAQDLEHHRNKRGHYPGSAAQMGGQQMWGAPDPSQMYTYNNMYA